MCVKRSKGNFLILSLYVDDILLAENDKEMHAGLVVLDLEMKDMSKASYVLRVKILRDHSRKPLGLSQETCIRKKLK